MTDVARIVEIISSTGVVNDMTSFDANKTFKENGIDSLDVFTIFLAVEEQLGVKFSEEESGRLRSASEIVTLLNSR
jgi:acyl carrier protein